MKAIRYKVTHSMLFNRENISKFKEMFGDRITIQKAYSRDDRMTARLDHHYLAEGQHVLFLKGTDEVATMNPLLYEVIFEEVEK